MQKDSKFLDDLAALANAGASGLLDIKREVDGAIALQVEKWLSRRQMATREEVDTVLAMLTKIRQEQDALSTRLAALEDRIGPRV